MAEQESIKETLKIIRKALEDDSSATHEIRENIDENILILNNLVNEDGTINILKKDSITQKEVKEILKQERLQGHPLWSSGGGGNIARYQRGVKYYGGMVVKILDKGNREIFKLVCNAYECPFNQYVQILHTSEGVDPQYSLFGCYQQGNACIPTIINKSR